MAIGDWEDRVSLFSSIAFMRTFCQFSSQRINDRFKLARTDEVFADVYDSFFAADHRRSDLETANLRDHFHMDSIGMGAIVDKYGIILVAPSSAEARLIVKDWTRDGTFVECNLSFGEVEKHGMEYVTWGERTLKK